MTVRFSDNDYLKNFEKGYDFKPQNAIDGSTMPQIDPDELAVSATNTADMIVSWSSELSVSRVAIWPRADDTKFKYAKYEQLTVSEPW